MGTWRQAPVVALIPVHDEAASLGAVLDGLAALDPAPAVLVVDDGSTDGSGELARARGARVLRHPRRRGNGAALRSGLAVLSAETLVVVLDGDGQHDPARVPALLAALREGADLAVGARERFVDCGPLRRLGNVLLADLAAAATGHPVPDLTSGFRAFRRADVESCLPHLPQGFSSPTTTTLCFLHDGRAVRFVPMASRPRRHGRTRTRLLRDGGFCLRVALKVTTLRRPRRLAVALAGGALGAAGLAAVLGVWSSLGVVPLALALALLWGRVVQRRGVRPAPRPTTLTLAGEGP